MSSTTENIGSTIKMCRHKRGLQLKDLAEETKLSVSYLSLIEQGKRTPNLEVLETIAKALDIPLNILVFLATDKSELAEVDAKLAEKLSFVAWRLIDSEEHAPVQK
jgi:transcriptional regulator with XRE-family HTH domain